MDDESEDVTTTYRIVDDTTVPGNSLAERRLKMLVNGVTLKKLSRAVFFLGDLVKLGSAATWFIDASGKVFNYKKRTTVPLTFHEVSRILPLSGGGAIIEVKGIVPRFKCLYAPKVEERYVGLLKYRLGYILYGFYTQKYDKTRRLI